MNYTEAVDYILNVPKFTTKNKPEHTAELLKRLGHPDRGMKVIHVAGTNGKGSVCAFLSEMLTLAGKKTALFTSPHLVRINERFQINNVPISDGLFLESYQEVQKAIDSMVKDGLPEDMSKDAEAIAQKMTDEYGKKADEYFAKKEKDIMTI